MFMIMKIISMTSTYIWSLEDMVIYEESSYLSIMVSMTSKYHKISMTSSYLSSNRSISDDYHHYYITILNHLRWSIDHGFLPIVSPFLLRTPQKWPMARDCSRLPGLLQIGHWGLTPGEITGKYGEIPEKWSCISGKMIYDDLWSSMMIYDDLWWTMMIYDDLWWSMFFSICGRLNEPKSSRYCDKVIVLRHITIHTLIYLDLT